MCTCSNVFSACVRDTLRSYVALARAIASRPPPRTLDPCTNCMHSVHVRIALFACSKPIAMCCMPRLCVLCS